MPFKVSEYASGRASVKVITNSATTRKAKKKLRDAMISMF